MRSRAVDAGGVETNSGGEFAGRSVLVVGLGASGFAAARTLARGGAEVRVTEQSSGPAVEERARELRSQGVDVETGGHDLGRTDVDLAVLSPGVPPSAGVVEALRRADVEVISEVELAYRCARCDFLAVTGTNGKTTTTSLLSAMLAEAGIRSTAAGNIGLPLIEAVASIPPGGAIATEVSSFQLATTHTFRPKIAVLLNVAEDHTDWHGSIEAYAAAKARITSNQQADDSFVFNNEDPTAVRVAADARSRTVPFSTLSSPEHGIGIYDATVVWRGRRVVNVDQIRLPGSAGLEDAVAAAGAALEYGAPIDAVARAIDRFHALPHRLELVGRVGEVAYIDDSKATNPHATLAAVRGLNDVVLIAGGRSKGMDLSPLVATVPPVIAVVAIGESAPEIEKTFSDVVPVDRVGDMGSAVSAAHHRAIPGGSVLLSPGCASLDMYESYAARGDDFRRAVDQLMALETEKRGNGRA
jgi:UDP-N-acetylmuramoylalanine--D-glutamate ligase